MGSLLLLTPLSLTHQDTSLLQDRPRRDPSLENLHMDHILLACNCLTNLSLESWQPHAGWSANHRRKTNDDSNPNQTVPGPLQNSINLDDKSKHQQ